MRKADAADAAFMARALELAAKGRGTTQPNPRVGCVVVRKGKIVGEGFHERAGAPHAEIIALHDAGRKAEGADIYVTLEPCCHHGRTGPCTEVLIEAGVRRVVAAMKDPNPKVAGRGLAALNEVGIRTEVGLMAEAARLLNRGFVSRMTTGKPWVTLKLAMSLDGRTAMASGESKWITSDEARADAHRLRAEAGAVLTSASTVLADDPELTARIPGVRQPDRVVLDTRLRAPSGAKVWKRGARRIVLTSKPDEAGVLREKGVEIVPVQLREAKADMGSVLTALGRLEINEVLVECGPILAGGLLQADAVDELVIYIAPALLGSEARSLAHLPGLARLSDRVKLRFTETRMIGSDLRITAVPEKR